MKKLIISMVILAGYLFPAMAQVDHDQEDGYIVPLESLTLTKDQIPVSIVQAVKEDFKDGQAFMWGKFPYVLEKYGWIVSPEAQGQKPDFYQVKIKANDGSDIYAIYKPDGTILQSKIIRKDVMLPSSVKQALEKSQYKDWHIIGDKELIKYYNTRTNIEEFYRITVEKGNIKKTISFNYKEPPVS
jgi:hypothetical protein